MSTDKELLKKVASDLQIASATRCVLYLEDENDVEFFFALLGVALPPRVATGGYLHQGVLVRSPSDGTGGGGRNSVRRRIDVTEAKHGYERIFGIIDGDGEPLAALAPSFDAPSPGRFLRWKAYSIENLLAKAGWPTAWGTAAAWEDALLEYASYAAFNKLLLEIRELLRDMGLDRFMDPVLKEPLKMAADVIDALKQKQPQIAQLDVEQRFTSHLAHVQASIRASVDEGHTVINGKWLMEDYAPRRTQQSRDNCHRQWLEHVRTNGGLPEVRDLWLRLTGLAP